MTDTLTLPQFLEQCIADDEAAAQAAAGWRRDGRTRATGRWGRYGLASIDDDEGRSVIYSDADQVSGEVADHIATHDPARVLAQCEAIRAVVARHAPQADEPTHPMDRLACIWCDDHWPCADLADLAQIWRDRPGWQEAWA